MSEQLVSELRDWANYFDHKPSTVVNVHDARFADLLNRAANDLAASDDRAQRNSDALREGMKIPGEGFNAGEWIERPDGLWELVIRADSAPQGGYVLVPREPTKAMLDEAFDSAHEENAAGVWRDMLSAALSVAPSAPSQGGWRGIESAPRDGTRLILSRWNTEEVPFTRMFWASHGEWSDRWQKWWDGIEPCGLASPTHFMLVTPPPAPSSTQRGEG